MRAGSTTTTASNSSPLADADRKSTRLNSSHLVISYAVFCLKKKNNRDIQHPFLEYRRIHVPLLHLLCVTRPEGRSICYAYLSVHFNSVSSIDYTPQFSVYV